MEKSKGILTYIGFKIDPNENLTELSFNFPQDTTFMSCAGAIEDEKSFLQVHYIYSDTQSEFKEVKFLVAKIFYTEISISSHNYLGTITIGSDTYAVFYK